MYSHMHNLAKQEKPSLHDLRPCEMISDPVLIANASGEVLYANKALEKQTGFSMEDARGKKPGELWGGQMPREFYDEMWYALATQKQPFSGIVRNKTKKGSEYYARLQLYPVLADGELKYIIGLQLGASEYGDAKKLENVAGAMAHQLQSPITSENILLDLLQHSSGLSAKQKKLIEDLVGTNEHVKEIIHDMMVVSRLKGAISAHTLTQGNIRLCIEYILSEKEVLIKNKKLSLRREGDFDVTVPSIYLFERIAENLISNAVKYSKQGGEIVFSMSKQGDVSTFSCKDNGIGIPRSEVEYIFKQAYRGSNARVLEEGSGMGLYLAKNIADMAGYTLGFTSVEGKGSMFTLSWRAPAKN